MTHPRTLLLAIALSATSTAAAAQFDTTGWRFAGEPPRIETIGGRQALSVHDALAYLPSATFRNGTIEFDVMLPDSAGFVGVQFRMQGAGDYEDYYFRPMNSGAPDATQYQPVFNGNTGWQIYVGPRYTAPIVFRRGAWSHVKLVVHEDRAAVYVDADTIAQYIPRLLGPSQAGILAIYSRFSTARFANSRYDTAAVDIPVRSVAALPAPAGSITAWRVSNVIDEARVSGKRTLVSADLSKLEWMSIPATERGIANLGVAGARKAETNTVLARVDIESIEARTVAFKLGFSDRARVFLNSRLIYSGDASYLSRDPRFLGTVGLFDTLYLPLVRGRNSLVVAVSEGSGGWAIAGALESVPGVSVSSR